MDKKSEFEAQKRLKDHRQRCPRWPQHDLCLSIARRWAGVMLGPTGAPLAVIFEAFLGLKNPKNSYIWIEERLRNGSGTARETAEFRPSPRPALLLEIVNDRGESHFHQTRHRGGRAVPVPGCPEGRRFPRHSILKSIHTKFST